MFQVEFRPFHFSSCFFLRIKTLNLQKVKAKLMQQVELIESESKCVKNFQLELDMLIQEKLAHLEELRQIQNDILTVRNIFFKSQVLQIL